MSGLYGLKAVLWDDTRIGKAILAWWLLSWLWQIGLVIAVLLGAQFHDDPLIIGLSFISGVGVGTCIGNVLLIWWRMR